MIDMATRVASSKIHVMVVVGTRPEAIKMAPIVNELQARQDVFSLTLVNTGQHREMVDQVLSIFDIQPEIDLDIMEENQSLSTIFSKVSTALEPVFGGQKPHILLVEGDTSTVFVTALMAFYNRIDVGHVEAGLRTHDIYNPFPEEVNRRITSVISTIHFAPTAWAKNNLLKEGYSENAIFITGNPVIDALLKVIDIDCPLPESLQEIDRDSRKMILVTAHRRENHGKPLADICQAILELASTHEDLLFVYPVHPNPNVESVVGKMLSGKARIILTPPLEYLPFIHLMKKSYLILTDSGGIQEEAPTLKTPVLVLRKTTERPEAQEAGTARVVGTETRDIVNGVAELLKSRKKYDGMVSPKNPFGDGRASARIAEIIWSRYSH
jgi:UDP-N-acetylglucosamine 2-epimerase (non-hydrolysing)